MWAAGTRYTGRTAGVVRATNWLISESCMDVPIMLYGVPVQIARLWAGSNVPGAQCGGGVETDLHAYVRPPGAARDVDIALPIWL